MKEKGTDGATAGFKLPGDGWHVVEFQEGIAFLTGKGGEGIYQNERGFKTYKFPAKVKDDGDPDDGADCSQLVGMEKGGSYLANILAAVGLWEQIEKKFPGDDVSVWDDAIMNGVKTKLPGLTCMMKTEIDKKGYLQVRQTASFKKYKEILAEEAAKGGSKAGKKTETKAAAPAEEAPW